MRSSGAGVAIASSAVILVAALVVLKQRWSAPAAGPRAGAAGTQGADAGAMRILCFGDSLTEGYYGWGREGGPFFAPYTVRLQELLDGLGAKRPILVENAGRSGEVATATMHSRLEALLQERPPGHYAWVVILGGANDLVRAVPAERVAEALGGLHALARSRGARTVALTVPELDSPTPAFSELQTPAIRTKREAINGALRGMCGGGAGAPLLLDVAAALPQHSEPDPAARARLWDDGVHLTPEGYARLGELVFDVLRPHLAALRARPLSS
eukprot:tig00000718_g3752.t1